jgi:mRNA interferase RelE/StbE
VYEVEFTKSSVKDIKSISGKDIAKIMAKIRILSLNPYSDSLDIKKLKGFNKAYRLRIGEYRVIYEINNNKLVIKVVKIAIRGDVYG